MSDTPCPPPLEPLSANNSTCKHSSPLSPPPFTTPIKPKYRYCPENHPAIKVKSENSSNFDDNESGHSSISSISTSSSYSPPPAPSITCNFIPSTNTSIKTTPKRMPGIWECEECHKRFQRRSSLSNHQRIHNPASLYKCSHCSKGFTRRDHMRRHMRIHTGEKPFECEICQKRFYRKDYLGNHLKTFHKAKQMPCKSCNKTFLQNNELLKHTQIMHTPEGIAKRMKEKEKRIGNKEKKRVKKVKKIKKKSKSKPKIKSRSNPKSRVELMCDTDNECNSNDSDDDSYAKLVNNNQPSSEYMNAHHSYSVPYVSSNCNHSNMNTNRPCLLCSDGAYGAPSYINQFMQGLPPPPPPTNANIIYSNSVKIDS